MLIWLNMFTFVFIFVLHLLNLLASVLDIVDRMVLIGRSISEMALLKSYFSIKILLLVHEFWVLHLLSVIEAFLTVVFLLLIVFDLFITNFWIFLNLLFLLFFLDLKCIIMVQITFRFLLFLIVFFILDLFLFLIIIFIIFIKISQLLMSKHNRVAIILKTVFNLIDFRIINLQIFKELRFILTISFFHNILIKELSLDIVDTLNIRIRDLTVLIRITFLNFFAPFDAVELQIKLEDENWMEHIDKSKAHSALSFQINWQIEVVVLSFEIFVNQLHHVLLVEFDGNISYH